MSQTIILAGLGNPGKQYNRNRHNVGFMLLDEVADQYNAVAWQNKFNSLITYIFIPECSDSKILLVKPQTYMNNSGQAIREILSYYKLPLENLFVVYDDLDLPLAKVRVKTAGGAGGHNGVKSVNQYCGNNYNKVKIGIDRPKHKESVQNYVLSDFNKDEREEVELILAKITQNLHLLLTNQSSQFMNKIIL